MQTGDLGGDLRFEPETVFLDPNLRQHLAPEDLVAGFHVGEVEVGEDVGRESEHAVADHVPEVHDAMGVAAHEARAEHDIRFAVEDGLEQLRVFLRVVLEIGVLHDDEITSGGGKAGAQRGPLALVALVIEDPGDERDDFTAQNLTRPIGRAVIHDDDLLLEAGHGRRAHGVDNRPDGFRLVETGNDDGKLHAGWGAD